MPELPDLTVYLDCIEQHAIGQPLLDLRLGNPFLLRTVEPSPTTFIGQRLMRLTRMGKRLVLSFDSGGCVVVHLMILGRLHWKKAGAPIPKGSGLLALDFASGTLLLTESGSKRRAALHLFRGATEASSLDRGGLEPLVVDLAQFRERLMARNHTLKRALTDQSLLAGIGNAYSDEILHRARLSPFKQTQALSDTEWARLFDAVQVTLREWTQRLAAEARAAGGWPPKVTAFREEMAVHGRYKLPCPDCGAPIQRIVYADNECNYCARCQTEGRLLADRALSRLLHDSWPKSVDDL